MLNDRELARREGGRVIIRDGGLRLRWDFSDLTASDGHRINGSFSCTARALPEAVERKMLEEVFLSRAPAVVTDDVVARFRPKLEETGRRLVAASPGASLLTDATKSQWIRDLTDAANAVAFSCGVAILAPFEAELDSPTIRLAQEEQRRGVEQSDRMTRASALFKQFQEIRAAAPDLSPGQVLQRIGASDQADMLRSLLVASAKHSDARALWAVAGEYLVKIAAGAFDTGEIPTPQLIALPRTIGPLRSVQAVQADDQQVLLVGGRNGVLWVETAHPEKAIAYIEPDMTSSLGFNAAILAGGMLWATHGDAGLVAWRIGESAAPARVIRPAASPVQPFLPRNLFRLDDTRVGFTSADRLMTITATGDVQVQPPTGRKEIVAVINEEKNVIVVHEDGLLCRHDRTTLATIDQTRRCGKVTAAGALPWLGAKRLLLASEEGPVYCVGLDDELITQYISPYRGLRLTAASALVAAGLSPDRQRIILWPTWDGRKPATEIHVAGIAKHRVADIEFA